MNVVGDPKGLGIGAYGKFFLSVCANNGLDFYANRIVLNDGAVANCWYFQRVDNRYRWHRNRIPSRNNRGLRQ